MMDNWSRGKRWRRDNVQDSRRQDRMDVGGLDLDTGRWIYPPRPEFSTDNRQPACMEAGGHEPEGRERKVDGLLKAWQLG